MGKRKMKKRRKQLHRSLFQRLAAWPKPRRSRARSILYSGIPSLLLLLLVLIAYRTAATQRPVASFIEQNKIEATTDGIPLRLRIPAINLNGGVEEVGVLAGGNMATPIQSPWEDVGWYNGGPRPGERGSAVIDGHLDRPGGYPAVFWRLRELHLGDDVLVLDSAGNTLYFRVTRIAYYPPQSAPIQKIFDDTSGIYLNLITEAGDWIQSEHQTTLRLVVYTTFVGKQ